MADRFLDIYLPPEVPGYPCNAVPRFSTTIAIADSGAEQANRNWRDPLWRFTLPDAVRYWDTVEAIKTHWLVTGGPAQTFPFRDPTDFASIDLETVPIIDDSVINLTMLDQRIGVGDGVTTSFQIVKVYQSGTATYSRPIYLPIVDSVLVSVGGADVSISNPWTVTRPGGVVSFTTAPAPGQIIRAGYLFDVEVRFEADDSFSAIVSDFNAGGFAALSLLGVRSC